MARINNDNQEIEENFDKIFENITMYAGDYYEPYFCIKFQDINGDIVDTEEFVITDYCYLERRVAEIKDQYEDTYENHEQIKNIWIEYNYMGDTDLVGNIKGEEE